MLNVLRSSAFASSAPYRFPFTSRRLDFSPPYLRAIFLVLGTVYAVANLSAELVMNRIFNGVPQPPALLLTHADTAVRLFPFDPHLRATRRYIRQQLEQRP